MTDFTVDSGYIQLPVTTDPDDMVAAALDAIAAAFPGWTPREGHLEVALLEQFAQMASTAAQVAASMPVADFIYFGSLVGVTSQPGASATVTTTWTMIDNAGYTIPAGTIVGFQVTGTDLVLFETLADFTIDPGSTATDPGAVEIAALDIGTAGNGIAAGTMTLVDSLAFVESVVSTATTSGGLDAEAEGDYLDRLSAELRLLTPRPILAADFALLAPKTTGVARALAIDGLLPGRTVTDGSLTSGAANLSSATGAFTNDDLGRTATGTGIPGGTTIASIPATTLTSGSNGAVLPQATINVVDTSAFTTAGTITVVTSTGVQTVTYTGKSGTTFTGCTGGTGTMSTGGKVSTATQVTLSANATATNTGLTVTFGDLSNVERAVTVAGVDSAGAALSSTVKTALDADLQAKREVNFKVTVIDATYTTIDVTYAAVATDGTDTTAVRTAVNAALADFLSPATFGGGDQNPPVWNAGGVIRYLDIAYVIHSVTGLDHITNLSIGVHGGSLGTADITLTGNAPLPVAGTISGTVTS